MKTITVLGAGNMGAAIARRLLASGYPVTVWNRTPSRAADLTRDGAREAATPDAAVDGADLVITMLTDAAAVAAALPATLRPGTCVVQMSTIAPAEVRALAARLPGVDLVDAPVGGSVGAVTTGTLRVLAGGDPAVIDRAAPVLAALGTVVRCGPLGAGSATKLVLNTALGTAMAALADALAVADAVGLDRDAALETLAASALGGAVSRARAPGAAFRVALAAKDLDLALDALDPAAAPAAPGAVVRAAARVLHAAPDPDADLASILTRP
ncbi:NAD(P)-dependent oxidoreductase [Actinomycetes bacterium KLBMP 9797]